MQKLKLISLKNLSLLLFILTIANYSGSSNAGFFKSDAEKLQEKRAKYFAFLQNEAKQDFDQINSELKIVAVQKEKYLKEVSDLQELTLARAKLLADKVQQLNELSEADVKLELFVGQREAVKEQTAALALAAHAYQNQVEAAVTEQHLLEEAIRQKIKQEEEISALNIKLIQLEEKLTAKKVKVAQEETHLSRKEQELLIRNKNLSAEVKELISSDQKIQSRKEELAKQEQALIAVAKDIAKQEKQLDIKRADLKSRSEEYRNLESSISSLEQKREQKKSELATIQDLQFNIDVQTKQTTASLAKLQAKQRANGEMLTQIEHDEIDLATRSDRLIVQKAEIDVMISAVAEKEKVYKEKAAELEQLKNSNIQKINEVQELDVKLALIVEQMESFKQKELEAKLAEESYNNILQNLLLIRQQLTAEHARNAELEKELSAEDRVLRAKRESLMDRDQVEAQLATLDGKRKLLSEQILTIKELELELRARQSDAATIKDEIAKNKLTDLYKEKSDIAYYQQIRLILNSEMENLEQDLILQAKILQQQKQVTVKNISFNESVIKFPPKDDDSNDITNKLFEKMKHVLQLIKLNTLLGHKDSASVTLFSQYNDLMNQLKDLSFEQKSSHYASSIKDVKTMFIALLKLESNVLKDLAQHSDKQIFLQTSKMAAGQNLITNAKSAVEHLDVKEILSLLPQIISLGRSTTVVDRCAATVAIEEQDHE